MAGPNPVTDLTSDEVLYLQIGDDFFEVSQFNCSYAVNEVPTAQCIVGIGRDTHRGNRNNLAAIHDSQTTKAMTPCKVYFMPKGEADVDERWSGVRQIIFEGYLAGIATRMMHGQVVGVVQLHHWLVDLTFSSCLTAYGAPSNPASLSTASILPSLNQAQGVTGHATPISGLAGVLSSEIDSDVWSAIKKMFNSLASFKTAATSANCFGNGNSFANNRALTALKYIEGGKDTYGFENPGDGFAGRYSVPLALKLKNNAILSTITEGLASQTLANFANATFWNKLVAEFCPAFQLAVIPMARRALVIADLPGYRGGVWRTISPDQYDSLQLSRLNHYPIRGVGVYAPAQPVTQLGVSSTSHAGITYGACYIEDSVADSDGILHVVAPPFWLRNIQYVGAKRNGPLAVPEELRQQITDIYRAYAQSVYASMMLNGQTGTLSGRLRFDIAPGSIVKITRRTDNNIAGRAVVDQMAQDIVAAVNRVSIAISVEPANASTVFNLTHVRTADGENKEDRTSIAEHPLFGTAIHGDGKHGAPLVPAFEFRK